MRKLIIAAATILALGGCYNDKYEELYPLGSVVCDTNVVTYAADIKPILDSKCSTTGCHDAVTASGSYDFTAHSGVQPAALNGKIAGSINWTTGFSAMPQAQPKLSQCDIDKITRWINQGAPNN
jgi:hypothetical protein